MKEIKNIKEYVEKLLVEKKIIYAYKNAYIKIRKGKLNEEIVTYSNGFETKNIVKSDLLGNVDYVATKMINDKEIYYDNDGNINQWIISYLKLDELYVYEKDDVYMSKSDIRKFVSIDEDISFLGPWGEKMIIKTGGYLNINDLNSIYGIQEIDFKSTYIIL